jgi:cellulose synthase (UDP-forming)
VPSDSFTLLELLAPTLFVMGAIYVLGSSLPIERGWVRLFIFGIVWSVVGWYLHWRLFVTVLPADGSPYEICWLWVCFAIELLSLLDALILYITFLRTTNRSAEANRHEARIRALPARQLPSVDIFIPTYDEPIEVLEKTITGALCLDYAHASIWVLDDGRRPWLKEFCELKGVGYLNRPDNAHAKAGNINHALSQTSGDFIAIFDADFVPQRNFLMRTLGFFDDPKIGIVQLPHAFYNPDPMQANLALRKSLPDEQRFFFDVIMPSRDAWDAAFCCGSNSVTRRAALNAIGGQIPTQSITEDMLLSMNLLRAGYVTRYLGEKLAFGLAPETIDAFFIQRQRWARGAIQILYLSKGPLGRGLTFMQRLLFLPTHWLSLGLRSLVAIAAPIVFLWTGISPVFDVSVTDVLYYFLPMVLALTGGIRTFAPRQHLPLASLVQSTFLSFKILPSVLATFVKPFGHRFKVTPKGGTSHTSSYAGGIFWTAAGLIGLSILGLTIDTIPEWRLIEDVDALPIVAFWSTINTVVLFLVCMMSLQAPMRRGEERMEMEEPIWFVDRNGIILEGRIRDISLSGIGFDIKGNRPLSVNVGDTVRVFVKEVGFIAATIARQKDNFVGAQFVLPVSLERDLLIRKLFTAGFNTSHFAASAWSSTGALLKSIWNIRTEMSERAEEAPAGVVIKFPTQKLPTRSLIISPRLATERLSDIGAARRFFAA